jgi:hypothetical protein
MNINVAPSLCERVFQAGYAQDLFASIVRGQGGAHALMQRRLGT